MKTNCFAILVCLAFLSAGCSRLGGSGVAPSPTPGTPPPGSPPPPPPTSVVGPDGFLLVNGQKFFPVGYYAEGFDGYASHEYAASTLAGAGFNTMYTEHDQMNVADYTNFLNRCNTLGIKNLLSFYGDINPSYLNSFKSFPSLLSWSIADDGDTRYTPAEIQARHDLVRALDPDHVTGSALTTGVFSEDVKLRQYTAATDVSALEWYPVLEDDPENDETKYTYQITSRIVSASVKQGKSGMVILQTYNWKDNYPDSPYVWPSAAQIRAMSYTSVVAGAKGVLYYTLKDYTENSTINLTQPALWNATADFAAKMRNTLAPVVLNGTRINLTERDNKPYVHASYWIYNGRQYLIAVNMNRANSGDNGRRTVGFATGLEGAMINLFSDYPATLTKTSNGIVSGTMEPLEVQVYQVTSSGSPPLP